MRAADRLTVVIPSRGRPNYLFRSVKYWLSLGVRVTVCEEAPKPSQELTEMSKSIQRLDYRWLNASIAERLSQATSAIETEFCIWSSDDEFVLPSSLSLCMRTLDEQPWVGCSGRSLSFWVSGGRFHFSPVYTPTLLLADTNEVRIRECLSSYGEPLLWNLYRTDVLRRSAKLMRDHEFSIGAASELLHAVSIATIGAVGSIDAILRLRSGENANQWAPVSERLPTFRSWWDSEVSERETMLQALSGLTREIDPAEQLTSEEIAACFQNYLDLHNPPNTGSATSALLAKSRGLAARTLGSSINNLRFRRRESKFIRAFSKDERADLEEIRNLVEVFHGDSM